MAVRYGASLPLEVDMRVIEQDAHLATMAQWVRENQSKFAAGQWYFAGRPMD